MLRTHLTIPLILAIAPLTLGGCGLTNPETAPVRQPTSQPVVKAPQPGYLAKSAASRDPNGPGETAVEAALNWAGKYSQAMQTVSQLQQDNRAEREKSQALQQQVLKLQNDVATAQNELKEANAMLMEMRQELNKWKADILGYRQEMRDSQQVQTQALGRIIKLLGGEPMASGTAATQPAPATMEPAHAPVP